MQDIGAPTRPFDWVSYNSAQPTQSQSTDRTLKMLSSLNFDPKTFDPTKKDGSVELHRTAKTAWEEGRKLWEGIESAREGGGVAVWANVGVTRYCGGKPRWAHAENDPKISLVKDGGEPVVVSQFIMELQALKIVEGEEPPRILHFNPRLKGDWSGKPVIEHNTCYRMQWGTALRCEGWKSKADEETVDGQVKCEKWIRDDDNHSEESKATWWLSRLIGRTKKGYTLEDATGLIVKGNHFAERMAARKSWMQHRLIKSSNAVACFFVALHAQKEVNLELKKEAEFFGDIVIVPYMDNYDLVVLKTVAICEYGVRTVHAKHIMKGDDDTFFRVDAVIDEARKVPEGRSSYVGNINYYHKPLRYGKWAVTYEEWPEEDYPPYANGPGYILSSDIAQFIVSEFERHKLRLFKMEDVSMGMWVEQFNSSKPVEYVHNLKGMAHGGFLLSDQSMLFHGRTRQVASEYLLV
ncbi:hypothetical protein GH714_040809 [Hevea brasiliensis]|uniref:Hexosyltransferase n=1 Tax=Hevea brasiliensis TaxID=3981 RepID=A0A6A6MS30_HEVBR|nr:hypothetical protein GH714_040809 [Hevea brasiliensis]